MSHHSCFFLPSCFEAKRGGSRPSTPVAPPPQDADEVIWVEPKAAPKAMPSTSMLAFTAPAFSKAAQTTSQSSRAHVLRQLLSDSHRFQGMVMASSMAPAALQSGPSELLALEWQPPTSDDGHPLEAATMANNIAEEAEPEDDTEPRVVRRRISYKRTEP
jgi:hypothetical protein